MTREEIYSSCLSAIGKSNCLLLELPTGYGKTALSIKLVNHLCDTVYQGKKTKMLLLVAKRVHKQTWGEEFEKWGGIKVDEVVIECYESLKKYAGKSFDFLVADECFKGDTEILTNTGYKQFKDLTEEDLVAQFTQEGNIEFVKPLRLIKRKHTGEICKLHLGRGRYCYLTPNHNMVYKTPWVKGWRMKPVKDLCKSSKTRIPVSGKGTGNNGSLTALERLLIAIQADGSLQRHQINKSVYSISLKKDRKRERMNWILSKLNNWSKIKESRGYDRYLVKLPNGDAKLLSTHFNINMGYERANAFIEEIAQWDGYIPNEKGYLYYSSKEKANADFVSAVAVQAGYKVLNSVEEDNRQDNYSTIYHVFMRKVEDVDTQPMTKEYLPYDDYVYCVEVPTHMIVVRSEGYTFITGNCHHIGSDLRLELLSSVNFKHFIGLSATIPLKLKQYFRYHYHSQVVSCNIVEAIKDEVLPEPEILLFPLEVENDKGPVVYGEYKDYWKFKRQKVHAIIKCTQRQKLMDMDKSIEWYKKKAMSGNAALKQTWLYLCGKRLEFLADCKLQWVKMILHHLKDERTITFCKTIEQTEQLGENCIHSKNRDAEKVYNDFNEGKINHITAVNILNENANLVNCKYAIFANLASSEVVQVQRTGRALRHKSPVIIIPYYKGTREEEIIEKQLEGFKTVKTITSINEI